MELFDEDFKVNEKTDSKKATTIILVLIVFLIIMVLFVVGAMAYIKQTTLSVSLNGVNANEIKNLLVFDETNNQKVYVPIKRIAEYFQYSNHNGRYSIKSEDRNQCYVECDSEVAEFSLGSNQIYKTLINEDANSESFEIDDAVVAINGELYTTIQGIETAFNVSWSYNEQDKKMDIYSMPYLVNGYQEMVVNFGYDKISEDFTNQKAILDGYIIVEKGQESSNKKVAVLDITGNNTYTLLEDKYDEIQYLQRTKDFLVTSNKKKGIISNTKRTKVKTIYDDIKLMDYENKLYEVENSGKYGIIDFNGKNILDTYYSQIGIDDISTFKENDIRNKYILAGGVIPVKKDKEWALFDLRGKQLTDFKYDSMGYVTSNNRAGSSGYSLLVVPEYNVLIVEKEKKYNVVTSTGEEVFQQFFFDSIYLEIDEGNEEYKLEINGQTYNLIEQLDGLGYGKNTTKKNTDQQENNSEENYDDNNNNEDNNNANNNQSNEENNNNQDNNNNENNQQNNNEEENNNQ